MRILFTFLLVSWFSLSFGQNWQMLGPSEGQMPSSGSPAENLSMITDADGIVYIVYSDGSTGGKATVKKFDPTAKNWDVVGTPGISAGAVSFTGITTDHQKTPYIIYSDAALGNKAVVKFFDAVTGEWKAAGAAGISTGAAEFVRIVSAGDQMYAVFADGGQGGKAVVKLYDVAAGSWKNAGAGVVSSGTASDLTAAADDNSVYVAYRDGAAGNKATVRKFSLTTSSWETLGNAGFSLATAAALQLAVSGDKVYLAYSDGANGNKATVQQFSVAANKWEVTGSVGFTALSVSHLALITDKNNVPYILFRDGSASNKATVYRYATDGEKWEQVGIEGLSSGSIEYPAFARAADGSLYLGYSDASLNGQVVIKTLNPTLVRWESFGAGNSVTSSATHVSMAVDADGVQYLAYSEGENSGKAVVKKFDAARSAWQTVGVEGVSKGLATYTSLATGADKAPVIAYQDGANFNRLTVQQFDPQSGAWKVLGGEGFSAGVATYINMAAGSDGSLWVSYRDADNSNRAFVQKYNTALARWEVKGSHVSAGPAAYTSLTIDQAGVPYIAYQDGSKGNRVTVKKFNSGSSAWERIGMEGFSGGSASYTSLAFDRQNVLHVIYMDGSLSNRATVQRYNSSLLKWEVVGAAGFSSGSAAFAGLAFDGNNIPFAIYQDGSKGNRATVASFNAVNGLWEVAGEGISAGGVNYTSITAYQNKLYVAYQDGGMRGNAVVKTISRSAGNWISMGISSSDALSPLYNSIVSDKDNDVYLFYGNEHSGMVKKLNRGNGSWSVLGAGQAVQGAARFGSIALASDKVPYLAYSDAAAGDKITVKRLSGSAWEVVGAAGFSLGKANYTVVAADSHNTPYAVFQDEGNGGKGVVKKFDAASSSWKALGTAFSAQTADHIAMTISGDVVYVAYSDGAKNGRVSVKRFNAATNTWAAAGIEGFSAGKASYISLTADQNNVLYVVYQDAARAGRAVVKKFNAATSAWETVVADEISAGAALFTKISVDQTGKLYVVYRDSWNSDKATVKTFNDTKGAWETVIRDGISDGSVTYPALAVTPAGDVFASYANNAFAGGIQVVKLNRNTSVWENSAPATVSAGKSATYVSAAADRNGASYVAYRDNAADHSTIVKKYDPAAKEWTTVGDANLSEGSTSFTALAVSPNDIPWVAYQDSTSENKIAVRFFNSGNSKWELAGDSRVSNGPGTLPSLAIGADNVPYVAYADSNANYQLTVKRFDRTEAKWITTGPAGFSAAAVNSTSVAVSNDGVPYVAYMDGANSNRATVKRYAFGTDSWETVGQDKFTAGSASSPSLVFDRNGRLAIIYLDGSAQNRLTVQRYDAFNGWELIGQAGFSFGTAGSPTLTFDENNVPVVAYTDAGNGNKLTVQRYNSSRLLWESVGQPGSSETTVTDLTVLNGAGGLAVVSRDGNGQAQMRVLSQEGLSWQVLGNEGISDDFPAAYSSVAADGQGGAYVIFGDGQHGHKATVKQHNAASGTWELMGSAGFSAGETSYNAIAAGTTGIFAAYSDGGNARKLAVKTYNSAAQKWDNLGVDAVSKSTANYVSMMLDAAGAPHIAYQDAANGNRTTVQRYDLTASAWKVVGREGFSDGSASHQSLAVAGNSLWVSYTDGSRGNRVTVKKLGATSSAWETVGDAGFSMGATSYTNIAVDANGTPYVAYLDASNGNRITVQRFEQDEWVIVGTVGFSEPSGGYLSLVIDGDDIPYVSYRGQDARVKVSRYNAQLAVWEQVGNTSLSAGAGMYSSLAYAGGELYVAYQDAGLGNQVAVKQFLTSGAGWDDLGSGRVSSAARATFAEMAVDQGENIYITYQDVNGGNKAAVKSYRKDKAAWEALGSAAVSEGTASYTSLALNKDGNPYISYQDGSVFNKLTVKKYNATANAWDALGGTGVSAGTVTYNDITDLSGSPLVVYADGSNSGKLSSMSFGGTAWQSAGDAISTGQVIYPSLVSDFGSTAYVAYLDASLGRKAVVKKYDGGAKAWTAVGGETVTAHRADHPSITLDKAGTLYIAYQDSAFENRITVKKFDAASGSWETVGSEGFSTGAVSYTSIYVDATDRLFVLYRDGGKFNRATVMRFDAATSKWETVADEAFSAGAASYTGLAGAGTSVYAGYIDDGLGAVVDVKKMNENASGWDISGQMGVSAGAPVAYTSVLTNSNNVPLMLFSDGGKGNSVAVKQFDAASDEWKTVGTNDISVAGGQYPAFAVDSKDDVYVAYADATQGNRILAKRFDKARSVWETHGKGTFSLQAAAHISLAVAGDDLPYVAFRDQWSGQKITVRRYNSKISNWEIVGVDGFSDGAIEYTGIALNKANVPFVVYTDASLGNKIVVKTLTNDNWEDLDNASLAAGSYSSIVIDNNDVVYVAYRDEAQAGKATVKYFDTASASWKAVGQEGFTPGEASFTSVKVDKFNIPYVVYQDASNGNKVSVSRYNVIKKAWEVVGSWGISATEAAYPSMAIDRDNKPYIAYTSGQAFAQAYDGVTTISEQPENISVCKDTEGRFSVTASGTDNSYQWQVDDGQGFRDLADDQVYSGVNTAALTIAAVPESFKGYKYRVLIIGAGVVMSDVATVGINDFDVALLPNPDLKASESMKFEQQLPVSGGVAPFSYSLAGGSLPAGLELTADGKITGKPAVGSKGVYNFSVQLVESSVCKNVAVRDFTLTVEEVPASEIQVTQVVTPNGDGRNDYLAIPGIEAYPDNYLYIMNRNGTRVYQMKGYNNEKYPFVGRTTYGSDNLPAGTYFYVLEFTDKADGKTRRQSGYVVLRY